MQEKKPLYSCEDAIEKFVPRDHRLSYMYYSASNMMPIGDPRGGFFYLALMMDLIIFLTYPVSTMPTREEDKSRLHVDL